nr:protein BREAKING OF ASYMMETRY IN THE STOMATAL LINEAGE [Ipomoea batatas]
MSGKRSIREEDYIVFCFTEDGEIRLMEEDTKPEASPHLWPHTDQGVEKWRKDDGECAADDLEVESTDSNQSQASTASFAFPLLRWDWVGSPIKMPNPDGRKHKFRAWILRLCTFPNPCRKQNSL